MSQPRTYHLKALVVRTTKLAETDSIVTLVGEEGAQVRAVAKGARKPGSRFGSALQVGSSVRALLARGRSLDIVQEAKSDEDLSSAHADLEHASGLDVMCDLLSRVTVPGQQLSQVHPMTLAAIRALGAAPSAQVPLLTAAQVLKCVSLAGFRPSLWTCAVCGEALPAPVVGGPVLSLPFSYAEGGRLCADCAARVEGVRIAVSTLQGTDACIRSTFAQLMSAPPDPRTGLDLLRFCQTWLLAHLDLDMRSLSFMLTCGLYG